ncbi:GNAT family N-acetyltransferase [Paractinoplanes maris]|uniref:GNAT family N-acetyltransferase n=1 Tax=Paractinoplanes maris TaxID=1734446 RepID=UPI0020205A5E|nr:GNAT family N-acetyltransferase [Actinoplanes maris]
MDVVTGVEVRPVRANELRLLATDEVHFGLLRNRLNRRDAGHGELLAAWIGDVAVGHIFIWTDVAEEPEIRDNLAGVPLVMNLWVRDQFRHRGIGTELVRSAEKWLQEHGHRRVALGVSPHNKEAVRLYLRLLYDPWRYGDIKTEYEEFHDDGTSAGRVFEVCAVYVKELPGADGESERLSPVRDRAPIQTILTADPEPSSS